MSKNSKADSKNLAVNIKNLTYRYPDGNLALDNVSLGVAKGELIALLGPNGAGKSTLLLHLNGILTGSGLVEIFGEDITKKKRGEIIKEVGMVFQDPDDQLFMSRVFDDVAFGPLNLGCSPDEARFMAAGALGKVGLEGFENRVTYRLSGGEKRLVALATVLAMEPEILLLDEPQNGLDREAYQRIQELLVTLPQSMIIVSHDQTFLEAVTNRRLYLQDGHFSS